MNTPLSRQLTDTGRDLLDRIRKSSSTQPSRADVVAAIVERIHSTSNYLWACFDPDLMRAYAVVARTEARIMSEVLPVESDTRRYFVQPLSLLADLLDTLSLARHAGLQDREEITKFSLCAMGAMHLLPADQDVPHWPIRQELTRALPEDLRRHWDLVQEEVRTRISTYLEKFPAR